MQIQHAFALGLLSSVAAAQSPTAAEELDAELNEIHRLDAELAVAEDEDSWRVLLMQAARLKQSAIRYAIEAFQIDASAVATGVNYSPHGAMREREAATLVDGDGTVRVEVGDAAFRSPGWLGSTVAHEVEVHVNRQIARGLYYLPSDREGTLIQEVEAYDFELLSQKRFGLDADELRELRRRRSRAYRVLQSENRKQVDEGRYVKR